MDVNSALKRLHLKAFRYIVLVIFLVCNAVIASVAIWNLGLVSNRMVNEALQGIDAFLTFVASSGLLLVFAVASAELAQQSWLVGRVWFESCWVWIWTLMYFSGAVALTVVASRLNCSNGGLESSCVSVQVLLVFTWLCTMTVIVYTAALTFAIFVNKKKDPTIWHSLMRKFPWSGTCAILASRPTTPVVPQFQNSVPIIRAPKPKRPPANGRREAVFSYRSGLSHEYQIEHYQPPTTLVQGIQEHEQLREVDVAEPPPVVAPLARRAPELPPLETPENNLASFFYPTHMQQILNPALEPQRPGQALVYNSISAATQVVHAAALTALPSPPPLGDWPRLDALSQSRSRGKRKLPPIASESENQSSAPSGDVGFSRSPTRWQRSSSDGTRQAGPASSVSTVFSSYSPFRPMGPRRRSGSSDLNNNTAHRPPPLDLRGISSHGPATGGG